MGMEDRCYFDDSLFGERHDELKRLPGAEFVVPGNTCLIMC